MSPMPRTCTVCRHEARAEVDRSLLAGEPYRGIAKRWSLGAAAVLRHKAHIAAPVLAEWSASQAEVYAGLADYTAELERNARRIATEAKRTATPAWSYRRSLPAAPTWS